MEVIRHNDEVLEARIPHKEFSLIWISDLHFDSKHTEWKKVKKLLNENENAYIVIGGDGLDVMQFLNDRRGTKGDDKYGSTDYANRVINDARAEILPFKDRIISWNRGNHDNSIVKYHNLDLLQLICGTDIHIHEYTGYLVLSHHYCGSNRSVCIHFSHSPESGGKRSKGALAVDIAKAEYPSADIWIREHIHTGFIHPVRQENYIPNQRSVVHKNKWYVQNICAKDEHQGKRNGFHFERNMGNRTTGVCKMNFGIDTSNLKTYLYCKEINHILF